MVAVCHHRLGHAAPHADCDCGAVTALDPRTAATYLSSMAPLLDQTTEQLAHGARWSDQVFLGYMAALGPHHPAHDDGFTRSAALRLITAYLPTTLQHAAETLQARYPGIHVAVGPGSGARWLGHIAPGYAPMSSTCVMCGTTSAAGYGLCTAHVDATLQDLDRLARQLRADPDARLAGW